MRNNVNFLSIIILAAAGFSITACGSGTTDVQEEEVITIHLGGGVNMTMNRIEPGIFQMGHNDISSAQPEHTVTLTKSFYMGIYEVTQEQWTAVMTGTDNIETPSFFMDNASDGEIQVKRPVERVSWYDAIEFCNILSERVGLESVYSMTDITRMGDGHITGATVTANRNKNGICLPTEAEWEYACRAGTTTQWSFDDIAEDVDAYVWHSGNSEAKTHQAGIKKKNPRGLYDMHGNVWEWCWDFYDSYSEEAGADPMGPDKPDALRVHRGGSWYHGAINTRSAYREPGNPSRTDGNDIGFRVVRH